MIVNPVRKRTLSEKLLPDTCSPRRLPLLYLSTTTPAKQDIVMILRRALFKKNCLKFI